MSTREYDYALANMLRLVGISEDSCRGFPVRVRFRAVAQPDVEAALLSGTLKQVRTPLFSSDGYPSWPERLPVFAAGARPSAADSRDSGVLVLPHDPAALLYFMFSRSEEVGANDLDERGRFPGAKSLAYRAGLLDRPIVDEWAVAIRTELRRFLPRWQPRTTHYQVVPTHDIDAIRRFGSFLSVTRAGAGDLFRSGNVIRAWRTVSIGLRALRDPEMDPYLGGIRRLMEASERLGIRSAFFFKTAQPGPFDSGYDFGQACIQAVVGQLVERGHEVGFHPGFQSFDDGEVFGREQSKFEQVTGLKDYGGRQHNLRFSAPLTWQVWEDAGMAYDSTVGYADRPGFRCGTCHPFHPYDPRTRREMRLLERPLIVMDTTLRSKNYDYHDPGAAHRRMIELAARCKRVDGEFVFLWHNSSFVGRYYDWGQRYEAILADVVHLGGTSCPR